MTAPVHQFFRVGRLVPDDQELAVLPTGTTVARAIEVMRAAGFDQVPVRHGSTVVGVFSYRSLAMNLPAVRPQDNPLMMLVEDFLETADFVRASSEVGDVLGTIEDRNVVLIGDEDQLLAIATASDVSAFLWDASRPFILLQDIELATRHLMGRACADEAELRQCIAAGMQAVEGKAVPTRLDDLTYGELLGVLSHGGLFGRVFAKTFGRQRPLVLSVLEPVREVRNKVFHFRDEVTMTELDLIINARLWLQRKMSVAA